MVSDIRSDLLTAFCAQISARNQGRTKACELGEDRTICSVAGCRPGVLRSLMPGLGERAARVEDVNCE
jgi:hypothetical protein